MAKSSSCAIEYTLSLIAGKWKTVILYHLFHQPVYRFNELKKLMPDCSQRMLSLQLKELEKAGLIQKKVYPVVPPKTEYSLTKLGQSMLPVIKAMDKWGLDHHNQLNKEP
ncbi:HxlR family transcriptional regulator [Limosilactobacillus frumenti DSM 13145]|uniref:HxlR family transcriptional regulator n=1 Tax=Limosilactobacillus frumenti DSM 13145 TaxID=1423746 RepID=A0A0R1PDR8_9LACO|nr:helix-turn-helix domain-containing protein [Limosilactobacillus frumenti]KRL27786.1 HxlR family transcriptional regulator [Limosilactobacillus frumenti DSM 13145]MBA2914420.1 helix-turn-helix transcriptional regulator [Limosilactobacillus frumenti]QFG73340.1 helix-turn-helix transcriptional regulator [Limosilactobacillus frumenti]